MNVMDVTKAWFALISASGTNPFVTVACQTPYWHRRQQDNV